MPSPSWLNRLRRALQSRPSRQQARHPRRSFPLGAELLEDRAVPARFTVNTTLDTVDANPGDGLARDSLERTSLRAAVMEANALPGGDTIILPTGTYTLTIPGAGEDDARTGDLDVTGVLEIQGPIPSGAATINGGGLDRVFDIHAGGDMYAYYVTVTGGSADTGGGFRNAGHLFLATKSVVSGNEATVRGGGVDSSQATSRLTVSGSTFDGNSAGDINSASNGGIGGAVAASAAVAINDTVFRNNTAGGNGSGGAIQIRGAGTLDRNTYLGNRAGSGGAIDSLGTGVSINDSTFDGNVATRDTVAGGPIPLGGAIRNQGTVRVAGSTFVRNDAAGAGGTGGALANLSGTMTIVNSTISGNFAGTNTNSLSNGGGISNLGTLNLVHATIVQNVVRFSGPGGGVSTPGTAAQTTIRNTIIALNGQGPSNAPDVTGAFASQGGNLIGVGVGSGGWVGADQVGSFSNGPINPLIGPLQNNGGPTATHALLPGSPAIDRGVANFSPEDAPRDQRGQNRPAGPANDVGAFEVQGGPNSPPVAGTDSYLTNEDTPLNTPARGVLTNDTDLDGDPLTATVATGPTHGALTLNPDGSFVYTPAANYNGPDGFTYTVSDGRGGTATGTVSISVAAVNDAPAVTAPATRTTNEDTPLFVTGVSIADVDAGSATVAVTLSVARGRLSLAAVSGGVTEAQVTGNNTATVTLTAPLAAINTTLAASNGLRYLPNLHYNGPDTLTVSANDQGNSGGGGPKVGTGAVAITVTPVNDAPIGAPVQHTIDEDTPVSGTATAADAEGDPLTYSGDVPPEFRPAHGTVVVSANGAYTYTPAANFNGTDKFSIKVTDPAGAIGEVKVIVRVMPVNDAPVAVDDTCTVAEDQSLALIVGSVSRLRMVSEPGDWVGQEGGGTQPLVFDYAPPGTGFTARTNFDNGVEVRLIDPTMTDPWTLNFAAAGNQLLTPGTYPGAMRFPFQDAAHPGLDVSGDHRGHNMLTGQFTVYDVAYGAAGAVTRFAATFVQQGLDFDGTVDPPLWGTVLFNTTFGARGGVLANDTDVEDILLPASVVSGPSHGTLALNPDGTFNYTPNPNFAGVDTFTYRTNDGRADSNVATVTINVTPVNDVPVAQLFQYGTPEDTPLNEFLRASDPDGDPLTYTLVSQPAQGAVQITNASTGAFTYTPPPNFNGTVSFTFKVNDGQADSNTATIFVTVAPVNDAPVAAPQPKTTPEDTAVSGTLVATDAEGNAPTYAIVAQPAHGSITTFNATTGAYTYLPALNYNGPDSFTFKANDGALDSNIATVTVTVTAVNDAPTADPKTAATDEDTAVVVTPTGGDADGDALTFALVDAPQHGTVGVNAAGNFVYTPAANHNGPDGFTYRASDGAATSAPAAVIVTVRSVNDRPVADPKTATTAEDMTVSVVPTGSDNDGDPLSFAVAGAPAHGTVTPNPDGSFTYTPVANFNGTDSFTYTASDGAAASPPATVTVTVTAVNDAPVQAVNAGLTAAEGSVAVVTSASLRATDADNAAAQLTYTLTALPARGALRLNGVALGANGTFTQADVGAGRVTYSHDGSETAADSFSFTLSDGAVTLPTAAFSVTVTPVNDPPVANPDAVTVDEDTAVTVAVLANDTDADGGPRTVTAVTQGANGAVTFTAAGVTYTPAANFHGTDSFTYTVSDGNGGSATATVTVTVRPVNDAPTASAQSLAADEDVALRGQLAGADVDGDVLTFSLVSGPARGTLTLNPDGTFTYTPAANYNGPDSFTFRATDGAAASAVATVTLTVRSVNDAPTVSASPTAVSLAENSPNGTAIPVAFDAADVDGDVLAYALVGGAGAFAINPTTGQITVADSRLLDYETAPRLTLRVQVSDGRGGVAEATVTVDLTDVVETRRPAIDVRPGGANELNAKSGGKIEVAILGAADFDVRSVDVGSLRFGKTGREDALSRHPNQGPRYQYADVNGDGRLDLVVEFETEKAGFEGGETTAYLTGRLLDGTTFEASDVVAVKNPGRGR